MIEVSVIIPSYNKYPLNLLTLYSLEKQAFDLNNLEVIFIDDASTDETSRIAEHYHPPYSFKFIHCDKNVGRAKARNIGIQSAKGQILIFLDAEMITKPDFIQHHYEQQKADDHLVLTGVLFYKCVYSCIFPVFSERQFKIIESLAKQDELLYRKFKKFARNNKSTLCRLIGKEDIHGKRYKKLTVKKNSFFSHEILGNYGKRLEGLHFPWMAFLTGNVSLHKDLVIRAGMFNETFVNYGYEDWELGYRLYKMGARFLARRRVATYHQEHPVSQNKWHEAVHNYHLFTQLHPDVNVLILGLEIAKITSFLKMNAAYGEYMTMVREYPDDFNLFKHEFLEILKTVAIMLKTDISHKKLLGATSIDSRQKARIVEDIEKMRATGSFKTLIEIMEEILNS